MKKHLLLVVLGLIALGSAFGQAPTISAFSPTNGTMGTRVTITGTGFTEGIGVTFGGTEAQSVTVQSPTSIIATVGSGASGAVAVAAPSGTASLQGFTYAAPVITLTRISDGAEGGQNVQFRVTYSDGAVSDSPTTITFETSGNAAEGQDYAALSRSVVIPAGELSAQITLSLIDDQISEEDETVSLRLVSAATGGADVDVAPQQAISATISDNDEEPVSVVLSKVSDGAEGGTNAQFRVSIGSGANTVLPLTVNYSVAGSAVEGTDFSNLSGSITIFPLANSALLNIPITNDRVVENTETIVVTLTSASGNATVDGTAVTANVEDDDNSATNNRIQLTSVSDGREPGTQAQFRVSFPTGITSSVPTNVSFTVMGSATPGTDYTALSGSVTIPANSNSANINVVVQDDELIEGIENVGLTLTSAENDISTLSVIPPATLTVDIADNDTSPISLKKVNDGAEGGASVRFRVSFPEGITSTAATTVNYSIAGTASNGVDYNTPGGAVQIPSGANSADFDIVIRDDQIIEASETIRLTLTSATPNATVVAGTVEATIADNDNIPLNNVITLSKEADGGEPGTNARYTVGFPDNFTSSVATTVRYDIGGTATNGTDYTTLSGTVMIPAGANSAEILVVPIDDQVLEISETVALTLRSATNSVSTLTVRPAASVIANITDDDSSAPNTITLTKIQDGGEPNINARFRVSFPSGTTSSVVTIVSYSVAGGARSGTDYVALPGSVVIPANANSADIEISVTDDQVIEQNETVEITLTSVSNSLATLNLFPSTPVSANIADDDIPSITSFSPAAGVAGTSVTITGAKFDPTPENNAVYFGSVKAAVTAASPTSLTVTAPAGATYSPITVTVNGLTAGSSRPFIVTFPNNAEFNAGSFSPKFDFPTGKMPLNVAFADLNGDSKSELIVPNYEGQTVSIFQNSNEGGPIASASFVAKIDLASAGRPVDVAVGDLDGDGKLDLAVTNESNVLSVYRNVSSRDTVSFDAKKDYPTGNVAQTVAIGDVHGDGKLDLVVTNNNQNVVSVYKNTGTPGVIVFEAKIDFATGTGPQSVALEDLNGDRKPDIAVTNYFSNTVSILRNTSTLNATAFAAKVDFATGVNPYSVAVADLDLDGKPDLAVANLNSGTASVLRNTGTNGNIAFAGKVDYGTSANPYGIAAADLNGDGKPDLAVAASNPAAVSVFRNTSSSTAISFARGVSYPAGNSPSAIAIGDLNSDSKPDLTVTNSGANTVSVFSNLVDQPVIASISTLLACPGEVVTITGTNLAGTTGVTFGSIAAASYTVLSATTVSAVVPAGASGDVSLVTPRGTATFSGFTSIPVPVIQAEGSTTFASGGKVALTANTGDNYTYLWKKDGQDLPNATQASYIASESGSYSVSILNGSCSVISDPIVVNVVFTLPPANFSIATTSETCRTSNNGAITVSAVEPLNYTATLLGTDVNLSTKFTAQAEFKDLMAGKYNICLTVEGRPEFSQCYDVIITEPEDLGVYTAVSPHGDELDLVLSGSKVYFIELNEQKYTVSQNKVTLPLQAGVNRLKVSTDKECQGIVERAIARANTALVYPNPFESTLQLSVGSTGARTAQIEIRNMTGILVYSGKHVNHYGTIQLTLPGLTSGIYFLKLSQGSSDTIYKIIRK